MSCCTACSAPTCIQFYRLLVKLSSVSNSASLQVQVEELWALACGPFPESFFCKAHVRDVADKGRSSDPRNTIWPDFWNIKSFASGSLNKADLVSCVGIHPWLNGVPQDVEDTGRADDIKLCQALWIVLLTDVQKHFGQSGVTIPASQTVHICEKGKSAALGKQPALDRVQTKARNLSDWSSTLLYLSLVPFPSHHESSRDLLA